MAEDRIAAFPDGNSYVLHTDETLIIGNSEGLAKLFTTNEPDLEPVSVDILENITSLSHYGNKLSLTTTGGNLELVDLDKGESAGTIYRSSLGLRDSILINEGKRIICGGDDNKLVTIDLENSNAVLEISLPDQLCNISYNSTGEIVAVSLSNGNIQLYSVTNEQPSLIHTISNILNIKMFTSFDKVDFLANTDELISVKSQWSSNGKYLVVATATDSIQVYDRSDWSSAVKTFDVPGKVIDFNLAPNSKHLAVITLDASVMVFDFETTKITNTQNPEDLDGSYLLNLSWQKGTLYVGTTNGEVLALKDIVQSTSHSTEKSVNSLFLDEADEDDDDEDEGNDTDGLLQDSDIEQPVKHANGYKLHEEDSMIIDQDDELPALSIRKRHKPNGYSSPRPVSIEVDLKPYSPGSTPWNQESNQSSKRYLSMTSIGYVWSVQSSSYEDSIKQQTITVSFFDRSVHKDYHFVDYNSFDLSSINNNGVLLTASGYNDKRAIDNGKIFYRSHDTEQDSWERQIPLLKHEYITSVSLTDSRGTNSEAIITVGTSFGYLRFFNLHGVCINIVKTMPVVTLISSPSAILFMVNRVSEGVFTYSIIDINQDYRYIQQNVMLPLQKSQEDAPLIKGIFFNEYGDPCLVGGADDTLIVLQSWRETNNSKWVPLLNCHNVITEHGTNSNKKNWKCWPLGIYRDQLNCLILKNVNQYPGFPLPLPIELEIKLPISVKKDKKRADLLDELDDQGDDEITTEQDDPEENFLRSLTMGKIASDAMNDENVEESQDDIMERLTKYSVLFDRSLLKLFGESCKESRLNKALSIAKLIKTDKALLAASKISERMQFMNLATKIGKLREELVNLSDDDEDDE